MKKNIEHFMKFLRRKTTAKDHNSFNGWRDIKVRNWRQIGEINPNQEKKELEKLLKKY